MHPATKGAITCLNMKSLRVFSLNRCHFLHIIESLDCSVVRIPHLYSTMYFCMRLHLLPFGITAAYISLFTLVSDIAPVPAPVLIPIPVLGLIPRFILVLSVPTPCSSFLLSLPRSVFQSLPFLSLVYYSPFGTTSSNRRQVLLQELLATCRR